MTATWLVVDTSSPTATIALGSPGTEPRSAQLEQKQTSERLLATIDRLLEESETELGDLGGIVAVRGPGSFTGLRIGLATLYALHQASGVRAGAVSTLEALARCTPPDGGTVGAAVNALRGEWFVQTFVDRSAAAPHPEPTLVPGAELDDLAVQQWVGNERPPELSQAASWRAPGNLAAELLASWSEDSVSWDASALLRPMYLRAPAVTLPRS